MGYYKNRRINRKQKIINYYEEQNGKCAYCFNQMTLKCNQPNSAEVEHIIPKSHRTIQGHFNEVAACATCNREKANKPLRVFLAGLAARMNYER